MNNSSQTKLSIEERMEMVRNAKASSPEAAAAKLRIIGEFHPANLLRSTDDLNLLFLDCCLGDYDGLPDTDINHYSEFAFFFKHAYIDAVGEDRLPFLETEKGVEFVNSMVLLASMFLDKIKEKDKDKCLFNAFNMRLGDFWDAVIGTCVREDGIIDEIRRNRVIKIRDKYMLDRDPNISLKNEIVELLDLYQCGWYSFGKIAKILSCDKLLTKLDVDDALTDAIDHYMKPIDEFDLPVADFADDKVKHIRREILMPNECYSKECIADMRKSIKHDCFLSKFNEMVDDNDFAKSRMFCEIASLLIYHLLVYPFLNIQNYHYEALAKETK